jgi:hypothetical protein
MSTLQLVPRKGTIDSMPPSIRALLPKLLIDVPCSVCGVACMRNPDLERYEAEGTAYACTDCFYKAPLGPIVQTLPLENVAPALKLEDAIEEHRRRN